MQYARWVIHHPVWVDHSPELVVHEAFANVIGKTRTNEQHPVRRHYFERGLTYVNLCLKKHLCKDNKKQLIFIKKENKFIKKLQNRLVCTHTIGNFASYKHNSRNSEA